MNDLSIFMGFSLTFTNQPCWGMLGCSMAPHDYGPPGLQDRLVLFGDQLFGGRVGEIPDLEAVGVTSGGRLKKTWDRRMPRERSLDLGEIWENPPERSIEVRTSRNSIRQN